VTLISSAGIRHLGAWLEQLFRLYADERNARELQETAGDARSLGGFLAVQLSNVGPGDYLALLATCR
jgi:hypothetical protein